ncbi:DUF1501 domain-containing protein [Thalassoroseus pseudoceratinae]|uniref:DUF1501 domain-containing protein n=1 Tax=Thalassoroseus pseudoceratinae TaxID=2713176 RepID=UPI001F0DC65E|nr:DUF1501 domain-containing protein [Thalassoroseus pseudoceratinae]
MSSRQNHCVSVDRASWNRRAFLVASATPLFGSAFDSMNRSAVASNSVSASGGGRAKSTILFFLCGGASQLDTWDLKPNAPLEYRGPFQPIATSQPGLWLSEHLPMLARQAHHLAVVNSVGATVNTNDHHAGYYYNLTGHVPDITFRTQGNNRTPYPDDWPFVGSVVASRRPKQDLPNAITLPHSPSRKPYTRPGQFAAKLGVEHDPLYLIGQRDDPYRFQAPALVLDKSLAPTRLNQRTDLLKSLDDARRTFDKTATTKTWNQHQERAVSLLLSAGTTEAFDVSSESPETRNRYGETINGMSLLLARRLVEAEVPFITVFWLGDGIGTPLAKKCRSAGSWDTHGNNFDCLKDDLLPEFDRCFSALIEDLADRGLLDTTLVTISSEMGRRPKIGDPRSGGTAGGGRDHWTHCLTNVLAGGGIQGGQVYGASDPLGEFPADRPVTPADIMKTIYHAMGVENLEATGPLGRPFNLLPEGQPITTLF